MSNVKTVTSSSILLLAYDNQILQKCNQILRAMLKSIKGLANAEATVNFARKRPYFADKW